MSISTKKRTWKTNIYGNTVGYEGGKRAEEFGFCSYAERWAEAWCNGLSKQEAEYYALGVDMGEQK